MFQIVTDATPCELRVPVENAFDATTAVRDHGPR
jgi:hypothetical protein